VKWPLGDLLRAFFSWKWLKRTKGISIDLGGHEILLNEEADIRRSNIPKLDQPHRAAPHKP